MKKIGCCCDYKQQRIIDLKKALVKVLASTDEELSDLQLCEKAVNSPAPRFYISEERACQAISYMRRGIETPNILPSRREMHAEIYRRYCLLRERYPDKSMAALASHIIYSPAPKFYLTPFTAREFLFRHNREARKKRRALS